MRSLGAHWAKLRRCIEHIHGNIDKPLPIDHLAMMAGMSISGQSGRALGFGAGSRADLCRDDFINEAPSDIQALHPVDSTRSLWRVTFNNPPINLIDSVMIAELREVFAEVERDRGPTVLVFGSADPDYFLGHYGHRCRQPFPRRLTVARTDRLPSLDRSAGPAE
jgi:hypothetical protein